MAGEWHRGALIRMEGHMDSNNGMSAFRLLIGFGRRLRTFGVTPAYNDAARLLRQHPSFLIGGRSRMLACCSISLDI